MYPSTGLGSGPHTSTCEAVHGGLVRSPLHLQSCRSLPRAERAACGGRLHMSAKQLLQSAAAEINESVRRAHVSYDDAAAAISPPVFEYSFSPAPPRAIAVAPLTGISRGEHSSEHASTGPEGVCWVCCEGGHSFHHLIPMGCACRMPQASNPGLAGRSCSATHTFEPRLGQAARPASHTCGASSRWRCTTCAAGRPATCAGRRRQDDSSPYS